MRYSEEQKKEVIDFYNQTKSYKQVKLKYGVHRDTVRSWIDPMFHTKQKEYISNKLKNKRQDLNWVQKKKQYHIIYQQRNADDYKKNTNKWWNKNKHLYIKGGERYQRKLESEARWRKNSYTEEKKKAYYEEVKQKYRSCPLKRIESMARSQVARTVSLIKENKTSRSITILGCSASFYKKYIEDLMLPGMTWDNYGKEVGKWCIDHIIPLAAAKDNQDIKFKLCNFRNTRPMWVIDNLSKGDSYDPKDMEIFLDKLSNLSKNENN